MDQQGQGIHPVIGAPVPYPAVPAPAPVPAGPYQSYQQLYHPQPQPQPQPQMFWADQEHLEIDFKNHSLPLARIKKIMKADEDVRMIAAEAPVVFARACEMFILELTHCSWAHAEENKRRTLQKNDIAAAITRTDVFDFLVDVVPPEEGREDAAAAATATAAALPRVALGPRAPDPFSYYYGHQ